LKNGDQLRFWVKWPDNMRARYSPAAKYPINWVDLSSPEFNHAPLHRLITDLWKKVKEYDENYTHELVSQVPPNTK
jgi:hypothetical protein